MTVAAAVPGVWRLPTVALGARDLRRELASRATRIPCSSDVGRRAHRVPRRTTFPAFPRRGRFTPLASSPRGEETDDLIARAPPPTGASVSSPRGSLRDERGDRASHHEGGHREGGGDWIPLTLLAAAAIFVCYADRSNISTAIIPMARQYHWDKVAEGGVLSAFFYGYALTQIIGGRLADRFGGKRVLLLGVCAWSLATFITPEAAALGVAPLVLSRVALGAGEGVAFPAVHALIARHVPRARRTTAVATVTAASYAGAAFAFGVTPALVESSGGWANAFYAFGAAAVLWVPAWIPARFEAVREVEDLARDAEDAEDLGANAASAIRGGGARRGSSPCDDVSSVSSLPSTSAPSPASAGGWFDEWRALVSTRQVRAICTAQFAQSWGMYGLLGWLPTYFEEALGVEMSALPAFTVLPYFIQGIVGVGSGLFADALIRERRVSVLFARRAFQAAGMVGPAACLCAAAWLGGASGLDAASKTHHAAFFVDLGLALSALTLAGVSVSHLDVAPRHAGLVFATGNTCATLAGAVAVPFSGLVLERTGQNWGAVFGIIAAVYVVGAAAWCAWVGVEPVEADALGEGAGEEAAAG